VVVSEVPPAGEVVVSVPPPPVPPWLQADKAMGIIAKVRAKALARKILDKLESLMVVVPLRGVNSCRFLILFKFNNSRTIVSSF
jgi:hypothetical protein